MMIKEIPENMQGLANKRDNSIKKNTEKVTPIWLKVEEDGTTKIDMIKFANSIITNNPMVNNKFSEDGYWYDNNNGYWLTNTNTHIEKIIAGSMLRVGKWSTNTFSSIKKLVTIQTTSEADNNPFDHSNPYLVSFKNGTYNIKDGSMKDNLASDYILQGHNYSLDVNGTAPITNKWFEESFGSEKAAKVVKTFIGFIFVRTYDKYQKFMIFFGSGGDGKSTILNYLRSLIGTNNTSNIDLADLVDRSSAKFLTSKLYQKDLNYFADIGDGFVEQTSMLKGLTGGDAITGQFKNKTPFEFVNHAKLIFSANSLPAFNDFTNGFIRRPIIVKVHKIKNFDSKYSMNAIKAERGAFAYECMNLYRQLLDGKYPGQLDKWGFPATDEMQSALHQWIVENDMVTRWLDEKCDISDHEAFEKNSYVYESYKQFCTGEGGHPLGRKKFNASLKKQGFEVSAVKKINGKAYRGYKGITLLNN